MKKVFTRINSLVLTILSVTLFTLLVVSCETNQANPPKFEGLVNGYLPPMTVNVKDYQNNKHHCSCLPME